jgi:hypothetical protein
MKAVARSRAGKLLAKLEARDPQFVDELRADPLAALEAHPAVAVRYVPDSQIDTGCGVVGAYLHDTAPPVVAIAKSASRGRRGFTGLHEFAHHLQQTDLELMDELLAEPDGGRALEEATCHAFAAAVQLPDAIVDARLAPEEMTARAIVEFWRSLGGRVSRSAMCVQVAERLRSPGLIVLLNADSEVHFCAPHGLPPVPFGSDQGNAPVIRDAWNRPNWQASGITRFTYRDGIRGGELHAQTFDMDGYLITIAVTDRAPGARFTAPSRDIGPAARWWICEQCGHEFRTFERSCQRCRAPHCPDCGRCDCPSRVSELRCSRCGLTLPARMFTSGSTVCIDCA